MKLIGNPLGNPTTISSTLDNFKHLLIMTNKNTEDFEKLVKEEKSNSFVKELILMLMHNKKWWLTPIILVLLLFGALIIMGGSSYAPFIYTLF